MYISSAASKYDVMWVNIRSVILASLIIVLSVSRIFGITTVWHILEWVAVGLSSIVIIWSIIEVVRIIKKIKEASMYGQPFTLGD